MSGNSLLFDQPCVHIDVDFWKWLKVEKLDKQMLSMEPLKISGYCTKGRVCVGVQSSHDLAVSQEAPENTLKYDGLILNVNTLEDFTSKSTSETRQGLLSLLHDEVRNANHWSETFKILIISFAELKSYKFMFNCALPILAPEIPFTVLETGSSTEITKRGSSLIEFGTNFQISESGAPSFTPSGDAASCSVIAINQTETIPWFLRNILFWMSFRVESVYVVLKGLESVKWFKVKLGHSTPSPSPGWIKFGSSFTSTVELRSFLSSEALSEDAVTLNVKLMKWRLVPELEPEQFSSKKFLVLGSGTLGCSVARCLIAWGVKDITFVDSGKVAFSNPARQNLFTHADAEAGAAKAPTAAVRLKEVVPGVAAIGVTLEIPMPGHPASMSDYDRLRQLVGENDIILLLTDSRESRWLPSVMVSAINRMNGVGVDRPWSSETDKLAVSVALGFDSFLVKLQTNNTSCYFCNDVSAPSDSTSFRSLDLQCTVTRPGIAMAASAIAVEVMAALYTSSSARRQRTGGTEFGLNEGQASLGAVPDQVRGFFGGFSLAPAVTEPFERCICCSTAVIDEYVARGKEFVVEVSNDSSVLEALSTLKEMKDGFEDRGFEDVINFSEEDEY